MSGRTEPKLRLDAADDDDQTPSASLDDGARFRKFRKAEARPVALVDIRIGFWAMVWFMVKLAIASIPAAIILGAVFTLASALNSGVDIGVR